MIFSLEVEREEDGRWIAEIMGSGIMAYGDTSGAAVARAIAIARGGERDDLDTLLPEMRNDSAES